MSLFKNQQQGGGGGGLFGNQQQGGGGGGGGGGGLFGNQQQGGGGGGGGGGGLFGNNQQQQGGGGAGGAGGGGGGGGGLFGNQNKQGGGGLFGNQQGGGAGGGGGGGGLFGNQNKTTGSGGGLFGNQQQGGAGGGGGGLFGNQNKTTGSGGGLFGNQQQGGAGGGGSFSLFNKGATGGGMFGGGGGAAFPDLTGARVNKYQLSLTNSLRDRKVGSLADKHKQFIEMCAKVLGDNQRKIEALKQENIEIVKKKDCLSDAVYQYTQDGKQLYMKIKQARYLVDDMKSNLSTYEEITIKNFDVCLDLLKGGRLPQIEIPSPFMTNVTEYFDIRIRELQDKIAEIEELVKLADLNEDSEEYEKIIMVLDELYNYYLNVAHKVFQLNEYVTEFKAQFIDYFKNQGSREVERLFIRRSVSAGDNEVLGKLETISNAVLDNKAKKEQEEAKLKNPRAIGV